MTITTVDVFRLNSETMQNSKRNVERVSDDEYQCLVQQGDQSGLYKHKKHYGSEFHMMHGLPSQLHTHFSIWFSPCPFGWGLLQLPEGALPPFGDPWTYQSLLVLVLSRQTVW